MTYSINEIKEKTMPIAQKYCVDSMSIFGLYAHDEANGESNVNND